MKKERSLKSQAASKKAAYDKAHRGKKTILIPHPTVPKTWIERIVD